MGLLRSWVLANDASVISMNQPRRGSALDEVGARKLAVYLVPLTAESYFEVFFSRSPLFPSPLRTLTMTMFEYGFSVQVCCLRWWSILEQSQQRPCRCNYRGHLPILGLKSVGGLH